MSDLTFIRRANNTIVENKLEILFNLLLVQNSARPAFLLELADFPEIDSQYLIDEIQRIYPEFQYTIEYQIEGKIHRLLIHLCPLTPHIGDHDFWLADNLGFYSKGIPPDDIDRIIIHYILYMNSELKTSFYTEISPLANYSQEYFENRGKIFNTFAELIGGEVKLKTEYLMANVLQYHLDLIMNDELSLEDLDNLIVIFEGVGLVDLRENINLGKYTLEDLFQNRKLLLFLTLWAMDDPFEIYYPLNINLANAMREALIKSFDGMTSDPIRSYIQYEHFSIVKNLIDSNPNKKEIYLERREELFETYREFLEGLPK